jgi:hypothetical protein
VFSSKAGERHRHQFRKLQKSGCNVVFFVIGDIDDRCAIDIACDRKSARGRVARTPNRDFGNKKIFRENRVYGSSPLAKHQFWLESIGADSRRVAAAPATDL